ncbi:MAG: DUF986 domain-containing protein [Methanococci archaeon]|nr:DUF986 domain-containing protein [Methanococci archaeon]
MNLLLLTLVFLLTNLVIFKLRKKIKPNLSENKIFKEIKIPYLNLIEGKKAEIDKKLIPIVFIFLVGVLILLDILLYPHLSITSEILTICAILLLFIVLKSFNDKISVYLCDEGIYYMNMIIRWTEVVDVKKEGEFFAVAFEDKKIFGRKHISFKKRIYLTYDRDIDDFIKNHVK